MTDAAAAEARAQEAPPRPSEVLARLERELREIWEQRPGEPTKARVCTMNLVVVAPAHELAERYTTIVDDVTRNIPARAIVVVVDPEGPSELDGDVTAVCSVERTGPDGAAVTCSERLTLRASGALAARAGNAVETLLVPELPTSVVWLGRVHVDDPVFLELARAAHRIVLDTEYTSLASLLTLARWAREKPGRPSIADLAWTRIEPWQELCARFFDDPELFGHAKRIKRITLRQASEPGGRLGSEGALLFGWLATRLGWSMVRLASKTRFLRADGEALTVTFESVPRPAGVAPAALAEISIEAEAEGVTVKARSCGRWRAGSRARRPTPTSSDGGSRPARTA